MEDADADAVFNAQKKARSSELKIKLELLSTLGTIRGGCTVSSAP